jgi:beta-glucanase (GH16 family)
MPPVLTIFVQLSAALSFKIPVMKLICHWLLFLLMSLSTPLRLSSQYLWQVFPDTVVQWNYRAGDEFTGAVDEEKWRIGFPWGTKIFTQKTYVKNENIENTNGTLSFVLRRSDTIIQLQPHEIDTASLRKNNITLLPDNMLKFNYSGALLWSRRSYLYGYFELKFKGVVGDGVWPAFWLYGGNPNYEIDFFELKGEKEKAIHIDVHCPDGCSNFKKNLLGQRITFGHWVPVNNRLIDGFNVLAGEWTPEFIKWYLNGQVIGYAPIKIDRAMGLSIGTGIEDGKVNPQKKTSMPNRFEVDYLRIYRTDSVPYLSDLKKNLPADYLPAQTYQEDLQARTAKNKLENAEPFQRPTEVLTISLNQVAKRVLQFRVLGQEEKNSVKITIRTQQGKVLQRFEMKGNAERIYSASAAGRLHITVETSGKTIHATTELE